MTEVINQYSSSTALQAAIDSYGRGGEVFLDSKGASAIGQQPTTLSIAEVYSDNVDSAVPGGELDMTDDNFKNGFSVSFNQNIIGHVEKVQVYVNNVSTFTDTAPQVEESTVITTKDAQVQEADVERTARIVVTISGVEYVASFTIPSSTIS